jgi:capsid protein
MKIDILSPSNDLGYVIEGKTIANDFAARTSKEIVNLPPGSKLAYYEGKQEKSFKEFYDPNVLAICATFGIPVEVALMKYEGSFSSSRAGLKDWEHTLKVDRKKASSFKQMVFNYWLDVMVLQDKIDLPEYMDALYEGNWDVLNAYRNCEWIGSNVPHIDPEKEVRAERAKLGALGVNAPLTTVEASTLALNGGNSVANISQFANELKECEKAGIPIPQPQETIKSTENI